MTLLKNLKIKIQQGVVKNVVKAYIFVFQLILLLFCCCSH